MRLVGSSGEDVEVPDALRSICRFVIHAMERKQALFLMPDKGALTTQGAADFLGMSRPYLTRLLTAGKIPYFRVGTHRRIQLSDLVDFRDARNKTRNAALSEMTRELVAADVYDRKVDTEL